MTAPALDDLRERLVGHRFPGGMVTLEPYEAWLGHDAMRSPTTDPGTDVLDPLWILVVGLRGMGTDIAGVIALAGSRPADGVLFGELELRQHAPLHSGVEYAVTGGIDDVTRREGRRAGVFDTVVFALELSTAGEPVAGLTSSFLFPRRAS
jgi:hypothetical protein